MTDISSDAAAVATDGTDVLLVADYPDTDSAKQAYESLRAAQDDTFAIDAAVVVERGDDGKLHVVETTDHSTRDGVGWGAVAGAVIGILFPPTVLAGAAVGGLAGGVIGKLRDLHHNKELEDDLDGAITPGHSAVVVVAENPQVVALQEQLAKAIRVTQKQLSKEVSNDIKQAVKSAQ